MNIKAIKEQIDIQISEIEKLLPSLPNSEVQLKRAEIMLKLRKMQMEIDQYLESDLFLIRNEKSSNVQIANGDNNHIVNEQ